MDELKISVPKWQLSVSKSSGIEIPVDEIPMPEISMPGDEMLHGASRRKFASFPNGFPSNGGPTDFVSWGGFSLCFLGLACVFLGRLFLGFGLCGSTGNRRYRYRLWRMGVALAREPTCPRGAGAWRCRCRKVDTV